jgi:hypothetical protein
MQEGLKIVKWHVEFERKQGEYGRKRANGKP